MFAVPVTTALSIVTFFGPHFLKKETCFKVLIQTILHDYFMNFIWFLRNSYAVEPIKHDSPYSILSQQQSCNLSPSTSTWNQETLGHIRGRGGHAYCHHPHLCCRGNLPPDGWGMPVDHLHDGVHSLKYSCIRTKMELLFSTPSWKCLWTTEKII